MDKITGSHNEREHERKIIKLSEMTEITAQASNTQK